MKVQTTDGSLERRVLTGMVVDTRLLAKIAERWDATTAGLMRSPWADLVAGWCVEHFNRYGKAPGKAVESLFEDWAEERTAKGDAATVQLVQKFLADLSGEYSRLKKESNTEHLTDIAGKHFDKVRLWRLQEALQADVEAGEFEKGYKRVSQFGRTELGGGGAVDLFKDKAAFVAAFAAKSEPLITYPGALGNFFGDALERDGLICFMAAEKKGKTWALLDVAYTGILQGKKVAFFEVGDLSQAQIMRRFAVRIARRPMKAGVVHVPKEIEPVGEIGKKTQVVLETKEFDKPLSASRAWAAVEKVARRNLKGDAELLKLYTYPNGSVSALGVRAVLTGLDRRGWAPDIVVIDYADLLAAPPGFNESRDQINATWKTLRAISQQFHCLVVTATQAKASAYGKGTIDRSDFAEDKRKLAHATGIVGINQDPDEKAMQVQRLNWIVLREWEYSEEKCVHVTGCLGLARPFMLSTF